MGNILKRLNVSRQSRSMRSYNINHCIMEQHEKSAIACEKPVYDAIPLNILDETNGKSYRVETDKLEYYPSNPPGMLLRLFLFWLFWAILVVTFIITVMAYYCVEPRLCIISDREQYLNITNKNLVPIGIIL